jgi:alpha-N-dichloroacetyl-p-aminophenylserinol N-oxygenase
MQFNEAITELTPSPSSHGSCAGERSDSEQGRDDFRKIGASWEGRASVRKVALPSATSFERQKKDFVTELLPFYTHPRFVEATQETQARILSCAWLAYNQKTIDIEARILAPACTALYEHSSFSACQGSSQDVIGQTMTDEAYHVLLTRHASDIARAHRGLEFLRIPRCNVVTSMLALQDEYAESWKKDLVVIVTAIVTEVFICDYLRKMSSAVDVQPMNVLTTKMHLVDELAHASIFRAVARKLYQDMSTSERSFYVSLFAKPVEWFADRELDTWGSIFEQIQVSGRNEILGDLRAQKPEKIDMRPLHKLFIEMGMDLDPSALQQT